MDFSNNVIVIQSMAEVILWKYGFVVLSLICMLVIQNMVKVYFDVLLSKVHDKRENSIFRNKFLDLESQ